MDKLEYIKEWISKNEESGYYISQTLDENGNNLIGDAYGPMSSGRYMTIDEFYNQIIK